MPEITVLALGTVLTALYVIVMAIPANLQLGPKYTMSPRDGGVTLSGVAGRLHRAHHNQFEALVMYGAAAAAVALNDASSGFTAALAWIWLTARVLYLPLYAMGAAPWRSIVWGFGFFASALMALAAAFG